MAQELTAVEQVVSRALRDNLSMLKRTAEEFRQAMDDLVSACASSKPTNTIPPMLRAQTAAASLAAALEVLSRFVTASLQPPQRLPPRRAEAPAPTPVEVAPPPPPVQEAPPPPPEPVVEAAMEEEVVE